MQDFILPNEYQVVLTSLLSNNPVSTWSDVSDVIETEFPNIHNITSSSNPGSTTNINESSSKNSNIKEVSLLTNNFQDFFISIEKVPIASASLAQVHIG